jgi:hypothetical protein
MWGTHQEGASCDQRDVVEVDSKPAPLKDKGCGTRAQFLG